MTPTAGLRLRVALLTLGSLGAILTAGGPVFLAADVMERSRGYRPDGIGLIVPGLAATALIAVVGVIGCWCVLGSGRHALRRRARGSSALAVLPVAVSAGITVVAVRHISSDGTHGAKGVWLDVAADSTVAFAVACAALVAAAVLRHDGGRYVVLVVAIAALLSAAALQPYLMSPAILGSALAVSSGIFTAQVRARERGHLIEVGQVQGDTIHERGET